MFGATTPSKSQIFPARNHLVRQPGHQLDSTKTLRVAIVLTRDISGSESAGRVKTLRNICTALDASFQTSYFRLRNLVEIGKPLQYITALVRTLLSVVQLKPLPLQSVLHSGSRNISQLASELCSGSYDAIYLDSVRSQLLLRKLRRRLKTSCIIVDLDDLMSRRMDLIISGRQSVSLGYLRASIPLAVQRLIEGPLSRTLARYESVALRHAEQEMSLAAASVILVSAVERDLLKQRLPDVQKGAVHALPPPAPAIQRPILTEPFRFIFIGSDALLQNRLSIDFLIKLWAELTPAPSLHIYGRQERRLPELTNVTWHGYIDDLHDAYTTDTIMVLPVLLPGGIKTKAIEAWSFGRPVLGNVFAFEGLGIEHYPLEVPFDQWRSYILSPQCHSPEWLLAANIGHAFVQDELSPEKYTLSWRNTILSVANLPGTFKTIITDRE